MNINVNKPATVIDKRNPFVPAKGFHLTSGAPIKCSVSKPEEYFAGIYA